MHILGVQRYSKGQGGAATLAAPAVAR